MYLARPMQQINGIYSLVKTFKGTGNGSFEVFKSSDRAENEKYCPIEVTNRS